MSTTLAECLRDPEAGTVSGRLLVRMIQTRLAGECGCTSAMLSARAMDANGAVAETSFVSVMGSDDLPAPIVKSLRVPPGHTDGPLSITVGCAEP